MGKKRRDKKVDAASDGPDEPFNNPFAALGGGGAPAPAPTVEPEDDDTGPAADPVPGRAVIRIERKGRGGKTATLVSHLDLEVDALERFCKKLRKMLGCGGAVEDDTIALQGDQRDRVQQALESLGVARISVS